VVSKLESAGHTTIPLSDFPSFKEATSISMDFFDLDNSLTSFKFIEASDEPWVPSVKDLYTPPPEGRTPQTLEKVFNLTQARWAIRAKWHRIFMDNKLDVILAPGAHQTAMSHDTFRLPPYTVIWNLVPVNSSIDSRRACL
jgi:amidase